MVLIEKYGHGDTRVWPNFSTWLKELSRVKNIYVDFLLIIILAYKKYILNSLANMDGCTWYEEGTAAPVKHPYKIMCIKKM